MDIATGTLGVLMVVGVILAIVLIIAWIVLPFAVIGTKPLLRELVEEARTTNAHLKNIETYAKYQAEVTRERFPPVPKVQRLSEENSMIRTR